MGTTNDDAAAREAAAEEKIEFENKKELEEMCKDYAKTMKERYAIQSGAGGTWTVIRRVNKQCPDYPEDTPFEEFYASVCICATPTMAVAIAEALEKEHPHGDIV